MDTGGHRSVFPKRQKNDKTKLGCFGVNSLSFKLTHETRTSLDGKVTDEEEQLLHDRRYCFNLTSLDLKVQSCVKAAGLFG